MALGKVGGGPSCVSCRAADCGECDEILSMLDDRVEASGVPWDYASVVDRPVSCLCFNFNRSAHWAKYYKE